LPFYWFPENAPLGSFPEGISSVGAVDMSGNVREWVPICFHTIRMSVSKTQLALIGELQKFRVEISGTTDQMTLTALLGEKICLIICTIGSVFAMQYREAQYKA
jgi:hypothetical protein